MGLEFERAPTLGFRSATLKLSQQTPNQQDEDDGPENSSLSVPPSEPSAAPLETNPKRSIVKQRINNKRLKRAPAESTHSVSSPVNKRPLNGQEPRPITDFVPLPPRANPTKTSKLSKLRLKQKEAPAKKGQANPASKFRPKIPAASVAEVQEDVNLVEGNQDAVSSNPNLQLPSNNNKEQLQQDTEQTTNSSTNYTAKTYSAPQVNNNPSNRIT
ncbi:hypothetical protein Pst134EA_030293 [Puccinia striiformis f. sp. tritici]|uniref:Uncharacterized protein n=1 Tax=Puccinia striiformis TaxID=27350 RepID=A0A2S4UVM6_9BASI|nr:hypothetical protein Pst134EA_030293 [Puccinia striiformis f. sp. tritici]KAH9446372.1 hypothetical protein Pst134EA_030293 [Puccinia striiformis f. sp. tritici]KAI9600340.1 hypothetical protein H4Q26_000120 [Puccinia striiformis f. sp. tritici PST-130]POW01337.1 hypothetical protein PSTT_12571 [Puccinia striiformis]